MVEYLPESLSRGITYRTEKALESCMLIFYSGENIAAKFETYERAKRSNSSELDSVEKDLREIFSAKNLDFDSFVKATTDERRKRLGAFSRQVVIRDFLREWYKFFRSFPRNENLMERIVDNYACANSIFKPTDSLRLKILKLFIAYSPDNHLPANRADLDEKIFSLLFDPKKWSDWLQRRLVNNQDEQTLLSQEISFTLTDEEVTNLNAGNEKLLAALEQKFCAGFLERFKAVDASKGIISRVELYEDAKINLLIESNCVLSVICPNKGLGQCLFSLKEFVAFLIELIKKSPRFELPTDLKGKLIRRFKLNEVKSSLPTVQLLEKLCSIEIPLRNSKTRTQLLENVEQAISKSELFDADKFVEFKTEKLLELHYATVRRELKNAGLIGHSCGLDLETWTNFFLEQIAENRPITLFCFSAKIIGDLAALSENNVAPSTFAEQIELVGKCGNDSLAKKMHEEIVAYLKQFRRDVNPDTPTYGHAFHVAWRGRGDKFRNLLKEADDIANTRFGLQRSSKPALYRLAMTFNFDQMNPIEKFRQILDDIYSEFFISSNGEFTQNAGVLSEGINYKNYAEVTYLYFMTKTELSPSERIRAAEDLIAACQTEAKVRIKNPTDTPVVTKPPVDLTKKYREDFFNRLIHLPPEDFKEYLLANYHIYAPDDNSAPIMRAAQGNSAIAVFNELCTELKKSLDTSVENHEDFMDKRDITFGFLNCGLSFEYDLVEEYNLTAAPDMKDLLADEEFRKLFSRLEKVLNLYDNGLLNLADQKTVVSRTDILALYYVLFVNTKLNDFLENEQLINYESMAKDFRQGLNARLEKANFKPFSVKSVMDDFLLFCLFMRVAE